LKTALRTCGDNGYAVDDAAKRMEDGLNDIGAAGQEP